MADRHTLEELNNCSREELITIVLIDYYGAAEPPVRCGVSHLSGLTEPLH